MNKPEISIGEDVSYIDEITVMLRDLLRQVIRQREPAVLSVIDQPEDASGIPPHLIEHALQAIGIWLQLLSIAEENAAIRNRRQLEKQAGPDDVVGSLSHAFGQVAAFGVSPENVQKALDTIDVQPTITAHPTEAKRVTVLEIHRRIYLKLYELEAPRWTPRERKALLDLLRGEIDLLWMTGEIRFVKPTVESEISWGLHFFREALFDRTSTLCDLMEFGLQRHYPELPARVKPPLKFSSWIGGDRDGNPFVNVSTTRFALAENRRAAVDRLSKRVSELVQLISLSSDEVTLSDAFMQRIETQLEATGQGDAIKLRNPVEPFRQFLSALKMRTDAIMAPLVGVAPFANINELISELMAAENALADMKAVNIAATLVRPVRWEAEIFGFRTVSLDIRQNTTVINRVLQEIWTKMNPVSKTKIPELGTVAWTAWIVEELKKPFGFLPRVNCWIYYISPAKHSTGQTLKPSARLFYP
jgi:phosphoenolpyruvate carboxylase